MYSNTSFNYIETNEISTSNETEHICFNILSRKLSIHSLMLNGTEFCQKFFSSDPFIFATQCWIKNSATSNCQSLKYESFTPSGCKYMKIRKF